MSTNDSTAMRRSSNFRALVLCLLLGSALFGTACSSGAHQVISVGQDCTQCHSDQKQTYEVSQPKNAVASGGDVVVKTTADSVDVCTPEFTSEDGSTFVPLKRTSTKTVDGMVELSLEPGVWAVCVEKDSSSVGQIVVVGDGGDDTPTIEL